MFQDMNISLKYAGRCQRHGHALLVVAANESIKPQTREHLAILDLMEVPQAIMVITQSDLVDSDQITLVGMEIEDLIRPTRFAGAPVVAVSAVTGQGLDELNLPSKRFLKPPNLGAIPVNRACR